METFSAAQHLWFKRSTNCPIRCATVATGPYSPRVRTPFAINIGCIEVHGNSSGCFPGSGFAKLSVATDFQPVAEKHHPGETRPPEACESRFVRAAMSFPNSLTNNAVKKISARRSTLALGLHHSR